MSERSRRPLFAVLAVLGGWLLLEGICAGALSVMTSDEVAPELSAADPEWLVNAKSAYVNGFFITDDHTIWRPKPGFVGKASARSVYGTRPLVLNEHGHRSPELTVAKPDGVRRIMLLGGSHPYGMWVETDEAYVAVLGQMLEARDGPGAWEIINAACPGHTTFQGLAFLRRYGLAFEPDIVIFDLGMNDSLPLSVGYAAPDHEVAAVPGVVARAVQVAGASFVYRLLREVLQPVAGAADTSAVRVPAELTEANRRAVENLGRARGFDVLHLTQVSSEVGPGGVAGCKDTLEGFDHVADVCETFEALGADSGLHFHDPIHANASGHRLIAETVLAKLDALGWTD